MSRSDLGRFSIFKWLDRLALGFRLVFSFLVLSPFDDVSLILNSYPYLLRNFARSLSEREIGLESNSSLEFASVDFFLHKRTYMDQRLFKVLFLRFNNHVLCRGALAFIKTSARTMNRTHVPFQGPPTI